MPQKKKLNIGTLMLSWPVVAAFCFWGGAVTLMTSGHPILADVFYVAGAVLFLWKLLIWEELKNQRRVKRFAVSAIGVSCVLLMAAVAIWADHKFNERPYCYAIFYRTMGPDGSIVGGKEVLALVEELSDSPATNVNVTIQDWTGHPTDFDPKTLRSDFLPIVYPYFTGTHTACRYTPTHIVYEPGELGTEYWVTVSVGNGEDTKERIQFRKSDQCISFMRLKDQKVYIKDHLSPFDHFGGCLMSPSEMAKNPESGEEWTTACEAN